MCVGKKRGDENESRCDELQKVTEWRKIGRLRDRDWENEQSYMYPICVLLLCAVLKCIGTRGGDIRIVTIDCR